MEKSKIRITVLKEDKQESHSFYISKDKEIEISLLIKSNNEQELRNIFENLEDLDKNLYQFDFDNVVGIEFLKC